MNKIEQAVLLMQFVHANQLRQDNEPYYKHCERVAKEVKFSGGTEEMIIASLLHDCIEDTEYLESITNVIINFFGDDVWDLVEILTHDKFDREHVGQIESYNTYIERVATNPNALQIKWLDMIDNTSYNIPDKQWLKYRRACILLRERGFEIPEILKERLKI